MTPAFATLLLLLGADVFAETFDAANAAFEQGDYAEAAQGYELLVLSSAPDPALFCNLGLVCEKLGCRGAAVVHYERALRVEPGFALARQHLDRVLGETKHDLARPLPPAWEQGLLFWHDRLSYEFVWALATFAWVACWSVLGVRLWWPWRYQRRIAAVAALLALSFATSAWVKAHPVPLAVVVSGEAAVRFGVGREAPVRFVLYEGDRVAIDSRRQRVTPPGEPEGWSRVTTVSGERGWVQDADLVLVGPPFVPRVVGPGVCGGGGKAS